MLIDRESANKQVFLLDVGRHAGHAFSDTTSVNSNITIHYQVATIAIRQDVQKCGFSCATAYEKKSDVKTPRNAILLIEFMGLGDIFVGKSNCSLR